MRQTYTPVMQFFRSKPESIPSPSESLPVGPRRS